MIYDTDNPALQTLATGFSFQKGVVNGKYETL